LKINSGKDYLNPHWTSLGALTRLLLLLLAQVLLHKPSESRLPAPA